MSFSNLPRPAIPDDEVPVLLAIPDDEVPVLPRVGHGHGAPHVVGGGVQQVHHVVLDTRPPVILWWSPAHRTYSTLHYCTVYSMAELGTRYFCYALRQRQRDKCVGASKTCMKKIVYPSCQNSIQQQVKKQ